MIDWPERLSGLDVEAVNDGYVVYDPARDRVHYLNHTAALVLEACTGDNEESDIVRLLQVAFGLAEAPTTEVRQCLDSLEAEGLIR